jgi:flagellar FliL protein
MNNKLKMILGFTGVALLSAAVAGGAVWWYSPSPKAPVASAAGKAKAEVEVDKDKKPAKYVTLDKVIVMLRRTPNQAEAHYLSADLVLATTEHNEKKTKEHLPLLRSIAVRALSSYEMSTASEMTVQQYADELNRSFDASYAKEKSEKPFTTVMIGKLIIE